MFVYLFIGFIVMFLLYNLFSKKKSGTSNRPSKNEDQISAVQKNVSMAGLSLKSKFKIPDQGGVITISLPQSILNENHLIAATEVIDQLLEISSLYLFIECGDDDREDSIRTLITKALPMFVQKQHHLLFHSKNVGKIAFIRQLKPHTHIEYDGEVYDAIVKHVPVTIMQTVSSTFPLLKRSYPHAIQTLNDLQNINV